MFWLCYNGFSKKWKEIKMASDNLILNRRDMVLLKSSVCPRDEELYGNLFKQIEPYLTIKESKFSSLPFDDRAIFTIKNDKYNFFEKIKTEWTAVVHNDPITGKEHCNLCNRPIKNICYIHNGKNGKELMVGSECVKRFKFQGGEDILRIQNQSLRTRTEEKRRIQFDSIDIQDVHFINEFSKWFDEFPILLPFKIYNQISNKRFTLNKLRTDFKKKGTKKLDDVKSEYFQLKKELLELQDNAKEFYETHKNDKFICRRYTYIILQKSHKDIFDKVLRNNGLLDKDTLYYAYQPEFIDNYIEDFNQSIDNGIKITGTSGNKVLFKIENNDYRLPLFFTMPCVTFIRNIGIDCLTKERHKHKFYYHESFKIAIDNSNRNFKALEQRLLSVFNRIGYSFYESEYGEDKYFVKLPCITIKTIVNGKLVIQEYYGDDEYYAKDEKINQTAIKYLPLRMGEFIQKFKSGMFLSDKQLENRYSRFFERMSTVRWFTQGEVNDREQFSRSLSIKERQEFIKY